LAIRNSVVHFPYTFSPEVKKRGRGGGLIYSQPAFRLLQTEEKGLHRMVEIKGRGYLDAPASPSEGKKKRGKRSAAYLPLQCTEAGRGIDEDSRNRTAKQETVRPHFGTQSPWRGKRIFHPMHSEGATKEKRCWSFIHFISRRKMEERGRELL